MKTSIRNRLRLGFGTVLGIMAIIAVVAVLAEVALRRSAERALHYGARLNSIGLEMQAKVQEAGEQEKAFLLEIKAKGVSGSKQDHAPQVVTAITTVNEIAGEGAKLARDPFVQRPFLEIQQNAAAYAREFDRLVAAAERRGHVDTGAEGEFRNAVHRIENRIGEWGRTENLDKLEIAMLTLRRGEKDYLLRGREEYIDATHQHVEALQNVIRRSPLPAAGRQELVQLADRYDQAFDTLVSAEREMQTREMVCQEAAAALQRAAADASRSGMEASEASLASLTWTGSACIAIVVLISMAGFGAGTWFSRRISLGIVNPVRELTAVAETVSLGNTQVEVVRTVQDEIGDLQDALARLVTAVRFYQVLSEKPEGVEEIISERL